MIGTVISTAISTTLLIPLALKAGPSEHSHTHADHAEEHSGVAQQQEAHLHGHGELTLALEGNTLEIGLESPAANIVGFEHRATSSKQKQTLERAKTTLEQPKQLFVFSGTECVPVEAKADLSALISHDEDHHHGHHNKHQKDEDSHSEVTVSYRFNCIQGTKLNSMSVNLLDFFPGIEELDVMWITDNQQGSATLNSTTKVIRFR
ncbi:DUF2796 domain-containing protein [bacterium SCSIO 12696]|nr:DUF2796 domain-containing protein [bacterium SCSIO 12696]